MTQVIIDIPKVYIPTSVCRYGGKHELYTTTTKTHKRLGTRDT